MRLELSSRLAVTLLLLLEPAGARGGGDPLAPGWEREPGRAALRPQLGKGALASDPRLALAAFAVPDVLPAVPLFVEPRGQGILGPGDNIAITQDDGFALAPAFGWEGRLAPREGVAGGSDFLAFRFAVQQIARSLPVDVTAIDLGFDNRYGRTTWPLIGLKREDPATPLQPAAAFLAQVSNFSTPASALPAPSLPPGPDAFQRLSALLPAPVSIAANPVVDDGMWSDNFDRPVDENLDHPASDWLECDQLQCGLNKRLTVRSMRVLKSFAGDALGIKYPAADVLARRPITDLDAVLSVDYDVSAASASAAGLFFRLESLDRFYLVEYRKGSNQVVLSAMSPGGLQQLAPPVTPSGTATTGTLRVEVRGAHPAALIQVWLGSTLLISHSDSTYTYTGVLSGIGNLGGSTGEIWDNFEILREPDLFAVVQIPPGQDAALPAEWSPATVGFGNVLASTDGVAFDNVAAGANCLRAPNGYAQLRTASDSNLFQVESKLVSLDLSCPTCTDTRNLCAENEGPSDQRLPVFETGQSVELNAAWWNEHAPDVDFLRLEFLLYLGGCSDPNATFLTYQDVSVALDPGQQTTAAAVLSQLGAPGLSYTPVVAGDYCAWVIELYDRNGDGCFDGYEGSPCPVGCTCVGDPDENAATGVLTRDFKVVLPCAPLVLSEIVPASLRAAKDPADTSITALQWSTSGSQFRLYNIQMTDDRFEVQDPLIRDTAPTFARVLGGVPDSSSLQALPAVAGGVRYFAVFQNDGCASAWSLQDP